MASSASDSLRAMRELPVSMRSRLSVLGDLQTLYELLDELEDFIGGKKSFKEIKQLTNRPRSGVYFVFETNEMRTTNPRAMRITRVGTHAIDGGGRTLLDRLEDHWASPGRSCSRRSSIMRKHIGRALIETSGGQLRAPSWGRRGGLSKAEQEDERKVETRVREYIGDMQLLWVAIDEGPSRSLIERGSIGLLSNCLEPIDIPSRDWLGIHSGRAEIRRSGLWNVHHVRHEYDSEFLEHFEKCVRRMTFRST